MGLFARPYQWVGRFVFFNPSVTDYRVANSILAASIDQRVVGTGFSFTDGALGCQLVCADYQPGVSP
jgi:hypothetical protein